ncbi:MAG: glycosyltransferase [Candidatus Buchananbacteria bacterium]|nr:glycosyltransferase [Candidatus Buchananbacteria bacterium]
MDNKILLALPVYNEEKVLEKSVLKLYNYFKNNIKDDWQIVIVNNASIDKTKKVADSLAQKFLKVDSLNLEDKGRGNALKNVWQKYEADIYAYCDIDLATDIFAFKKLFNSIINGSANIAIGARYIKGSQTKRTLNRLIYSKVYIFLVRLFFPTKIKDFQCGFKAVDKKTVSEILPLVKDKEWFFDTELLLIAEKNDFKIKEIAVQWKENPETKVKFIRTIYDYIENLIKFKKYY